MKNAPLVLIALLFAGSVAADTTYTYPKDKPVLQITFPEGWELDQEAADEKSLVISSPDEAIELDLWALEQHSDSAKLMAELNNSAEEIGESIDQYVTDFKVSEKHDGEINGIKASMFGGKGKDKESGAPVNVEVTYLSPDGKQVFAMLYWGSDEAEKTHEASLKKISESLKKPA